jgi:hypothetical protein
LFAGVTVAFISSIFSSNDKPNQQELPARIQTLTKSLNSAAETIGQIEQEIEKRQELVAQLQRDADAASKLSTLNKGKWTLLRGLCEVKLRAMNVRIFGVLNYLRSFMQHWE